MMQQTAKIEKLISVALNTSEVTFALPEPISFLAGQYVTITLPTLKELPIKEQFRDFSIASAPEETGHISIEFRNSQSAFKKELLRGDKNMDVLIDGPKGIFTLPEDPSVPVVFLAGGIGITPFLSMIRHIVSSKLSVKPTLFYFNHSPETAAYLSELESYGGAISLVSKFARMTADDVSVYLKSQQKESVWYIAGPRGMVKTAREILTLLHIDDRFIKSEEFSGY